jgi:Ti-type conjugative transfer relaxase TraA
VIRDERTGLTHHYGQRGGVVASFIVTQEAAPAWAQDRGKLWNAVEAATIAKNGRLATELELALPHELNAESRRELVEGFARQIAAKYGVAVDVSIHEPGKGGDHRNHHAHVMITHRLVGPDGIGKIAGGTAKRPGLFNQVDIEPTRKEWADAVNAAYRLAGLDIRVDHRSHKDRAMIAEPTKHLGPAASAMERRGERSDRGDINRDVASRNNELGRIENERLTVREAIAELQAERQVRAEQKELRAAVRSASSDRILEAMTEKRATFSRDELIRELGRVVTDRKEAKALATELLAHPDIVGLRETADAPVTRYTTRQVIAAERQVLQTARTLSSQAGLGLSQQERNAGIGLHKHLDEEQRAAFDQLTSGRGLTILAGEAGTGKSTTLAAVRDAYERAGYRVVGMSWTNAVVQDMAADGFKETTTLASAFKVEANKDKDHSRQPIRSHAAGVARQSRPGLTWDKKTVLVVDEAGMLSSQAMGQFLRLAQEKGARVILAGDDRQLASIERGGLFGALVAEHGAAELHNVRRVQDAEQKRAFNAMHKGDFKTALGIFDKAGFIKWTETQDESRAALVEQWKQDSAQAPDKSRFVFAYTNKDVDALNADIRQVRKERGELGADHEFQTTNGAATFAKGDRIQFTASAPLKASRAQGLVNAGTGTIKGIEGRSVTVLLDGKGAAREVTFTVGEDKLAGEFNAFRHGYAGTIYKGQGRTIDQVYLFHSKSWRSASAYVALTRYRELMRLFVAREVTREREPWMMQTGGWDVLSDRDKEKAGNSYEDWAEENPKAAAKYGRAEYVDYVQGKFAGGGRSEYDLAQLTRQISRADETRSASQFIPSENEPPELARHVLAGPNRQAAMEKEAKVMGQRVDDRLADKEISNPMTANPMTATRREVWGDEKEKASEALWGRYQQLKQEWTSPRQAINREAVVARFKAIGTDLRNERQQIAKRTEPGTQARLVGDAAAIFRAMEKRDRLAAALEAYRLTREPPAWRAWVQDQAERGDKAAQVEMRRWQASEPGKVGEREQTEANRPGSYGGLTDGVEMRARNFRGGVEYTINGKVAVIDKGNVIQTVDKGRESPQAIALAVSLQAAKRGGHVKIDGNRAYKDRVADIAATRGLSVRFEDRKMQARYAGRLAQVRPGMKPPQPQSGLVKGGWFAHLLTPAPLKPSQLPALQPDLKPSPITPGQLTALRAREQQRVEQELSR